MAIQKSLPKRLQQLKIRWSHAKNKIMNLDLIPSNIQIIHKEGLDNKLIVQIPRSSYMFMAEKKKNNKYKLTMFDPYSTKRQMVGDNCTEDEATIAIQYALRPRSNKKAEFNSLVIEFKLIITQQHVQELQ